MDQSTINTVIGVVLAAIFAAVGFGLRRMLNSSDADREVTRKAIADMRDSFANELRNISVTLAELNTGASAGARAAIADLRRDMQSGFREVNRDVAQLRSEHDGLAERHALANSTTTQLAERVNGTRELVHELRRDVYRVQLPTSATPGGA